MLGLIFFALFSFSRADRLEHFGEYSFNYPPILTDCKVVILAPAVNSYFWSNFIYEIEMKVRMIRREGREN
jgi:hypothetical protein